MVASVGATDPISVNDETMLTIDRPTTSPKMRGEDGQAHRHHRAEREQQDDDGREQADEVGVARRRLVGVVGHRAAVRDLDAGLRRRRGGGFDLLEDVLLEVLGLGVELHGDDGDLAALGDERAAHRTVRVRHRRDVGDLAERGHARTDRGLDRRAGDAVGRLEHDERAVARGGGEVLLEEVERGLRLRVGDAEVVAVLAVERSREHQDRDRGDDPHADEPPAVPNRAPSQMLEES